MTSITTKKGGAVRPRRRGQNSLAAGLALILSGAAVQAQGTAAEKLPLRVCADPDNLPFTSSDAATPGLYMDLAQHLANQLGRTLVPVWAATYAPQRMMRTTLLAHTCDMFLGVPLDAHFMEHRVILSRPMLDVGYALVSMPNSGFTDLASLRGKHVVVQYGSPVQDMLALRDDVTPVTVTTPDEGMQALQQGRGEAALLWGPSAGYINHTRLHDSFQVLPLSGETMQWRAAIAFDARDTALRTQVDDALQQDGAVITRLAAQYGFPSAAAAPAKVSAPQPIVAGDDNALDDFQPPVVTKDTTPSAPEDALVVPPAAPQAAISASNAKPATAADIDDGNTLFNSTCSHCHGPDAVQGERRINLRLLHERYGNNMDQVFFTTVTHGRINKGMPNWSGVFTDAQFQHILAFLHSVQEKP